MIRPVPHIGEVARLVNRLRQHIVGRQIKVVKVNEVNPLVYVHKKTHPRRIRRQADAGVSDVLQWGTYFWFDMFERDRHPVFNLGRSGWIEFWDGKNPQQWPPENYHTWYSFHDDGKPFSFATVDRALDNPKYPPAWRPTFKLIKRRAHHESLREAASFPKNLGLDPVQDSISERWIKATLQDQFNPLLPVKRWLEVSQFIQGIGGWVADEILYQARLHPSYPSGHLSDEEISRLCKAIKDVSRVAVEAEAEPARMPGDWLIQYYDKQIDSPEPVKMKDGKELATMDVRSSKAVYVPEVQPLRIPEGLCLSEEGVMVEE